MGSLVEFESPESIAAKYPGGPRLLADGGTFNTIAGQPTDDSEMALCLARSIIAENGFFIAAIKSSYEDWLSSRPFDLGMTIAAGLRGNPNLQSQANGSLMRISPLGIFGSSFDLPKVADWAQRDAAITHPNTVCTQSTVLFAMALAKAIATGIDSASLYQQVVEWAQALDCDPRLKEAIHEASIMPPTDYMTQMGWVLVALQNALWQLLHAPSLEEALINTVRRGGDADTNAAICGALLGAVHGADSLPEQWKNSILNCQPKQGRTGVFQPRPRRYWPIDALQLADRLLDIGAN